LSFPADLYLEGSDQHRGWFQSSLLTSCAMHGEAPYRQVLTHGFTVDSKGLKMSKSIGNVVAPIKVTNTLGADILRLWVASTDYSGEMTISDEILKRTADSYRRIRNTLRFLLANTNDFNPLKDTVASDDLIALDRWIIAQALELQAELRELFDTFQFHTAVQKIHHFCSETLGGIYLDIVKDRQYTTQTNSLARRSCQTAVYLVTEAMTRWITPIMSFTADEVWENMPGTREELGAFTAEWFDGLSAYSHPTIEYSTWDKVILVRAEVSKTLETLRKDGKIGAGLDAEVTVLADQTLLDQLQTVANELRFMLITSDATLSLLDEAHLADSVTIGEEGNQHRILIQAQTSDHAKCVRCWHHRPEVNTSEVHPELCGRCIENVDGSGENRQYA